MHVAHMRRDARVEIERRLGDRKRVAGVDADADAARRLAEGDEFVAAEILMVLDRERQPFVGDARAVFGERLAHAQRPTPAIRRRARARSPHSTVVRPQRIVVAPSARAERSALSNGPIIRPQTDDRRHAERGEPIAQRRELVVAQRAQPGIEDLDRAARRARAAIAMKPSRPAPRGLARGPPAPCRPR